MARKNKRLVTPVEEKAQEKEFKDARWKLRAWMETRWIRTRGKVAR